MREGRTIDRARGRWRGILTALGIAEKCLDGRHHPCPSCGGKDRFRYTDQDDGGHFCSQCGSGNGFQLLMKVHGWDFPTAAKRVDEIVGKVPVTPAQPKPDAAKLRTSLQRLWRDSRPVSEGDPVWRFLRARGLSGPVPACLRYVPEMRYQDGRDGPVSWHPGMLALVSDAAGKPATLSRTYLTGDGRKAAVPEPRKLMMGGFPAGGAIRLCPPAAELGVAEGIETALAASALHGVGCWATLTEGFMTGWRPPAETRRVVICGDNDPNFVGQSAAYALARRLVRDGFEVDPRVPERVGFDWNDYLLEREVAA